MLRRRESEPPTTERSWRDLGEQEAEKRVIGGESLLVLGIAGVGKTNEEIEIGIKHNIACFNIESAQEVRLINKLSKQVNRKTNVAIRVNPNISVETHEYITTGTHENKFGISCEHLMDVIQLIEDSKYINLTGLHFHIGSQILNMDNFFMDRPFFSKRRGVGIFRFEPRSTSSFNFFTRFT